MATKKTSGSAKKTGSSGSAKKTSSPTTKKTAAKKDGQSRSRTAAPRAESAKRKSGMAVAAEAARQLLELTGREVEGIVGLERDDDGWTVQVEVVELRRIPETTDLLALYELTVDADGDLEGYRRIRRYGRGDSGGESGR
jgi:hypothetical protein